MIDFVDLPGYGSGAGSKASEFFSAVRDVDALVLVTRAFESDTVPSANGISRLQISTASSRNSWWLTASVLENRLERANKQRGKNPNMGPELEVLEKCKAVLEQDLPLRQLGLDEEEEKPIRDFSFLTRKPLIVVINADEEQMRSGSYPQKEELRRGTGTEG